MRRFKLDRKGFTLIELLAVITILGILMLILIPSVSRIIENSRKNSFLSTAKNYANAVRNEWSADTLYCSGKDASGTTVTQKLASSLNTGNFYVFIQSGASPKVTSKWSTANETWAKSNFEQLINSGGRSSWGNNEVIGYVRVEVRETTTTINSEKQMLFDYYVELIDSANHGIKETSPATTVDNLIRSNVDANMSGVTAKKTGNSVYECVVS